ncbi:MAG: flagellar basal body P-ring formation protein FlgA [Gammaproteobacteria bacterium]|nr:flagellar basal body P-ring formation protein FlgA [Gammaproteobacteria bacterium]
MKIKLLTMILLLGNSLPGAADSVSIQPLDLIQAQAKTFVEQSLGSIPGRHEVAAGGLDPRLRLPSCSTPLQTEFLSPQRKSGNTTVSVSCRSGKTWTIHLPVTVKSFVQIAVANRPVARNTPIQFSDIRLDERDVSPLASGYYTDIQSLVGKISKRPLSDSTVITPSDLDTQKIIRRGNRVTIIAEGESFSIRMEGTALSDATEGEQIPVENLSSQRKIEATAVAAGLVKVPM